MSQRPVLPSTANDPPTGGPGTLAASPATVPATSNDRTTLAATPRLPDDIDQGSRHLGLDPDQLDKLSSLFRILCDKTRLAIVQSLSGGEHNVTALCKRLQLPQPTVSHHLGLLRLHGLIDNRRAGKQVFYTLNGRICTATGGQADDPDEGPDAADKDIGGVRILGDGFSVHILPYADCPDVD